MLKILRSCAVQQIADAAFKTFHVFVKSENFSHFLNCSSVEKNIYRVFKLLEHLNISIFLTFALRIQFRDHVAEFLLENQDHPSKN